MVDRFHDAYTHTRGEFFLIRRLAGRWNFKNQCFSNNILKRKIEHLLVRFPDYLDRPTAPELSKQIEASLVDGADATPFYDSWSDK